MAGVVAFTSFTLADLPRALTLARGLEAHAPEWRRVAVLVDRPAPDADDGWRAAFDLVFDAQELYGEDWRGFVFGHEPVEACAAVKGRAFSRLFDDGAERVVFLTPDIAIFDDLAGVARRLDAASILLTPHQSEPNAGAEAIADNEAATRRYGVYNLGFLGVRRDDAGAAFARWFATRLDEACHDDEAAGQYLDQVYADLVPALFDGVAILRDPGCNVASWNLSRRAVAFARDGRLLVNGESTLKFYQFASRDDEAMTDRYAGRRLAPYELRAWRLRALALAGAPPAPAEGWAFGRYDSGARISRGARRLWRSDPDLRRRFADPFTEGPQSFYAYLLAKRPDLA